MTIQDVNAPTLAPAGEPCASCGSPLAADQRYCLSCGARRAQARLPFRDVLGAGAAPLGAVHEREVIGSTAAGAAVADDRLRTNLTVLGALACLLLALGIGVLLGRSGDSERQAAAPPAQVVRIDGAAAASADPAAAADGAATGSGATKGAKSAKSTKDPGSSDSSGAKASQEVQALDNASPEEYRKRSQKLPKQVGTGGPAPKVDKSKPAGGGSGFEEIG